MDHTGHVSKHHRINRGDGNDTSISRSSSEETPIIDLTCEHSDSSELRGGGSHDPGQSSPLQSSEEQSSSLPSPSLIEKLASRLHRQSGVTTAFLAVSTDHYHSERDQCGWACGFVNCQMLLSAILRLQDVNAQELFPDEGVPSVSSLQNLIEAAWAGGWDREGACQLGQRLSGSRTQIGTTEVAALLASVHLRPRIVDFCSATPQKRRLGSPFCGQASQVNGLETTTPREVHTGVECDSCGTCPVTGTCYVSCSRPDYDLCGNCHSRPGARAADPFQQRISETDHRSVTAGRRHSRADSRIGHNVMQWVWDYFAHSDTTAADLQRIRENLSAEESYIARTTKLPLYFQQDGHSRTIIGIEVREDPGVGEKYSLLVLDPVHNSAAVEHALDSGCNWEAMLKRSIRDIELPEYQILYMLPGLASGPEEIERSKTIVNSQLVNG